MDTPRIYLHLLCERLFAMSDFTILIFRMCIEHNLSANILKMVQHIVQRFQRESFNSEADVQTVLFTKKGGKNV